MSLRRSWFVMVGFILVGTAGMAATLADEIKLALKDAKFKPAEGVPADLFGYDEGEEKLFFYTNGPAEWTVTLPADSAYELIVKASDTKAQDEHAKFRVVVNEKSFSKEIALDSDEPKDYTVTIKGKAGENKIAIEFTNDAYKEGEYDRNLFVHAVTIKKK
jgi:hypothetical protein